MQCFVCTLRPDPRVLSMFSLTIRARVQALHQWGRHIRQARDPSSLCIPAYPAQALHRRHQTEGLGGGMCPQNRHTRRSSVCQACRAAVLRRQPSRARMLPGAAGAETSPGIRVLCLGQKSNLARTDRCPTPPLSASNQRLGSFEVHVYVYHRMTSGHGAGQLMEQPALHRASLLTSCEKLIGGAC